MTAQLQPGPRVGYGTRCWWWDSLDKADTDPVGRSRCPRCGGLLLEMDSEAEFWARVDEFVVDLGGDTEYREFVTWVRGRCRPVLAVARREFEVHRAVAVVQADPAVQARHPGGVTFAGVLLAEVRARFGQDVFPEVGPGELADLLARAERDEVPA